MQLELTIEGTEEEQTKTAQLKKEPERPHDVRDAVMRVRSARKKLAAAAEELAAATRVVREKGRRGRDSPVRKRKNEIKAMQKAEAKRIVAAQRAEAKRIATEQRANAWLSAAVKKWIANPANYVEECWQRDEQANLHLCPID